jgi:hypothetical protein
MSIKCVVYIYRCYRLGPDHLMDHPMHMCQWNDFWRDTLSGLELLVSGIQRADIMACGFRWVGMFTANNSWYHYILIECRSSSPSRRWWNAVTVDNEH